MSDVISPKKGGEENRAWLSEVFKPAQFAQEQVYYNVTRCKTKGGVGCR